MGTLRSVMEAVETILVSTLGYTRARHNFTTTGIPRSLVHKSYSFINISGAPLYTSDNRSDLGLNSSMVFVITLLWKNRGSQNTTGTLQEAMLDALDEFERVEDALVKNQSQQYNENNLIRNFSIDPYANETEKGQEFTEISFDLVVDVERLMS